MAAEKQSKQPDQEEFQPKGTLLIVILFIITMILLWGSVYLILLSRGVTV